MNGRFVFSARILFMLVAIVLGLDVDLAVAATTSVTVGEAGPTTIQARSPFGWAILSGGPGLVTIIARPLGLQVVRMEYLIREYITAGSFIHSHSRAREPTRIIAGSTAR
jgi:hypothetical protein